MAIFGLACEGVTDQTVLENILYGYYGKDYEDIDDEIQRVQPPFDDTDNKGGWTRLFDYLNSDRFEDDVINNNYLIIQIDTDVSEKIGFEVSSLNITTIEFIEKIIERLIAQIDKEKNIYQQYKKNIIFAISVHSLECWVLPLYLKKKGEIIHNCFDKLCKEVPKTSKKLKVIKNSNSYDKLSRPFLKHKELLKIASKNSSFQIFINSLPNEI
jgi:hypothetical protein